MPRHPRSQLTTLLSLISLLLLSCAPQQPVSPGQPATAAQPTAASQNETAKQAGKPAEKTNEDQVEQS